MGIDGDPVEDAVDQRGDPAGRLRGVERGVDLASRSSAFQQRLHAGAQHGIVARHPGRDIRIAHRFGGNVQRQPRKIPVGRQRQHQVHEIEQGGVRIGAALHAGEIGGRLAAFLVDDGGDDGLLGGEVMKQVAGTHARLRADGGGAGLVKALAREAAARGGENGVATGRVFAGIDGAHGGWLSF